MGTQPVVRGCWVATQHAPRSSHSPGKTTRNAPVYAVFFPPEGRHGAATLLPQTAGKAEAETRF